MVEKTKADRLAKKIRGGRQEGTEQDKTGTERQAGTSRAVQMG
jgi:hypothetical protein